MSSLAEHAPSAQVEERSGRRPDLWVRLPEGTDVAQIVRDCEVRGVIISPGSEWFPAEPSGSYVRLNYANADPTRFAEAAGILGSVLEGV